MATYPTKDGETFDDRSEKNDLHMNDNLQTRHHLSDPDHVSQSNEIPEDNISHFPKQPAMENSDEDFAASTDSPEQSNAFDAKPDAKQPESGAATDTSGTAASSVYQEDQPAASASPHAGKHFVVQRGKCQCDQGMAFPSFKVSSHQKHYWNDGDGQADYLAVTEEDLQFNPSAQPFGSQCKLQPSGSSYLPCSYAPAGKWQKTYDKVKVMGKSCVTEISELQCAVGGKITIMKHGQQSELGKSSLTKAKPNEQRIYNPLVDIEELSEELFGTEGEAW